MAKKRDNETGKYIKSTETTHRITITVSDELYRMVLSFVQHMQKQCPNRKISISNICSQILMNYLKSKLKKIDTIDK